MGQTPGMGYFDRIDETHFLATPATGGAWSTEEQHIAPALGLLAHAVEVDRDRRGSDHLAISRLSYDIYGTVPVKEVEVTTEVLRPGRTIELVEVTMRHGGRTIVRMRAWLLKRSDTAALAGTTLTPMPGPDELEPWDPTTVWPGGFIASVELRRDYVEPGRGRFWVRTGTDLVTDESASEYARFIGLLDIANGMAVRADPRVVAFPNVDLTAHLFSRPSGDWVGFDTRVSFGATGVGLTSSVLHDVNGPVGTSAQSLTVRELG